MEIKTKYSIKRQKIKALERMNAYIIYDEKTHENRMIIVGTDYRAILLSKFDNDDALCVTYMDKDEEVNVIGKVNDFDIVNVQYDRDYE